MIIAPSPRLHDLDGEALAALGRLDDDLRAAEAASPTGPSAPLDMLRRLRLRALDAYRDALAYAAGAPDDSRWAVLTDTVAAFVARIRDVDVAHDPTGAIGRLRSLVADGLATS